MASTSVSISELLSSSKHSSWCVQRQDEQDQNCLVFESKIVCRVEEEHKASRRQNTNRNGDVTHTGIQFSLSWLDLLLLLEISCCCCVLVRLLDSNSVNVRGFEVLRGNMSEAQSGDCDFLQSEVVESLMQSEIESLMQNAMNFCRVRLRAWAE